MRFSLKAVILTLALGSMHLAMLDLNAANKHYLFASDALSYEEGSICLRRYRLDACRANLVYLKRLRANSHGMYWMHVDRKRKVTSLKENGLEKGMHSPRKKITLQLARVANLPRK